MNIRNYFNSINNNLDQSSINKPPLKLIKIIFKIFFTRYLKYYLKNHSHRSVTIV